MANNYVQFCAELELESPAERDWLKSQLEDVELATLTDPAEQQDLPRSYIVPTDSKGYRRGYEPAGTFPRFVCDLPDLDFDDEGAGFDYAWNDRDEPGSVVFYAEECGCPNRVAYLVQKYLQQFHPDKSWSLTWSETCSKTRIGEFGGGGILVTAKWLICLNAHEFVAQQHERFEWIGDCAAEDDHPEFDSAAWIRAVGAGQTRLGYWDWVVDQLAAREREVLGQGDW